MILQSDVAHSGAKTDGNRYALNHCREPPSAKGSIHRLRRNKYVYYAAYTRANVLQLPLSEQFDGHEQRSKHVHDRRGGTGGGGDPLVSGCRRTLAMHFTAPAHRETWVKIGDRI
jgi:hypothetical protein